MTTKRPKIFISYSWSPISNKNWVKDFAERLSSNGIHVVLDIWDLKEGHDKYHFMEKMVNDEEIDRVLLICNKEYCEKANQKKGGVGTESMIISSEIYSQVSQEKFIPIIREYKEIDKPWIPTFLSSRLYVDLTREEYFESEYERLLRNIYEKPSEKRPPIGDPPAYLFIDDPIFLRTAHKVKEIKRVLIENKPNYQIFIDDYYQTYLLALNDHVLEKGDYNNEDTLDELYMSEIERMKILRDDFINFFQVLCNYSTEINAEKFHSFWEQLLNYKANYEYMKFEVNIVNRLTGCHISFLIQELFLYTIAIAVKNEKFQLISEFLILPYFINKKNVDQPEIVGFVEFNKHNFLFQYRNARLKLNRIDLLTDTIKARATNDIIHFHNLQEADLILYFVSCLQRISSNKKDNWPYWFPNLSVYPLYNYQNLNKLISQRYFDKFKVILGVETKEELQIKLNQLGDKNPGINSNTYYQVPNLKYGLNIDEIGRYR
jgi:hypothetical protein